MPDYTAVRKHDMEVHGRGFLKARASLGVSSFGMQITRMPPSYRDYPEHDHLDDGQEEVYMALDGGGWIDIEGERVELYPGVMVRIAPHTRRKVFSGPMGLEMLTIGACPGEPYKIVPFTELTSGPST